MKATFREIAAEECQKMISIDNEISESIEYLNTQIGELRQNMLNMGNR